MKTPEDQTEDKVGRLNDKDTWIKQKSRNEDTRGTDSWQNSINDGHRARQNLVYCKTEKRQLGHQRRAQSSSNDELGLVPDREAVTRTSKSQRKNDTAMTTPEPGRMLVSRILFFKFPPFVRD